MTKAGRTEGARRNIVRTRNYGGSALFSKSQSGHAIDKTREISGISLSFVIPTLKIPDEIH